MAENFKYANYYGIQYKIYADGTIVGPKRGIIKQRENSDGYMEITLGTTDNRHARIKVHRVVAEQFVPNPLGLPEVNHIDFNRKNNNADNLEWTTHQENVRHSAKVGHYANKKGEKNGRSKITSFDADKIRGLYGNGYRICAISKMLGISESIVSNVVHNVTWN